MNPQTLTRSLLSHLPHLLSHRKRQHLEWAKCPSFNHHHERTVRRWEQNDQDSRFRYQVSSPMTMEMHLPNHQLVDRAVLLRTLLRKEALKQVTRLEWFYLHRPQVLVLSSARVRRAHPTHSLGHIPQIIVQIITVNLTAATTISKRRYPHYPRGLSRTACSPPHHLSIPNGVLAALGVTATCCPVLLTSRPQ